MDGEKTLELGRHSGSSESQPSEVTPMPDDTVENRPPLLMQRPPSSGIDLTAFSFTKPASHQQAFSIRAMSTHGRINPLMPSVVGSKESKLAGPESLKSFNKERSEPCLLEQDLPQLQTGKTGSQRTSDQKNPPSGSRIIRENVADTRKSVLDSRRDKCHESSNRKGAPSRSMIRSGDGSRVAKNHRENRTPQISEGKLFELLIAKIRMREEKDAMVTGIAQQLETENIRLKTENKSLLDKAKVHEEQMHGMDAERAYQERQIGIWKERVLKFKQIVNELGRDFETLRLDSDRLKTTTASLQEERDGLNSSINDIKLQIARSEGIVDNQRMKIADYERQVSELNQSLLVSRERLEEINARLNEEKKRNEMLESYIQNYSRSQIRQVNQLRGDHATLLEKLVTGLENISEDSSNSREVILLEIRSKFEGFHSSIQELGEKCSAETRDVQEFANTVDEAAARIDLVARNLAAGAESVTKGNLEVSQSIEANTKMIDSRFGPESAIFERIDRCNTAHETLDDTLGNFSPMLRNLDTSVKSLTASGNHLVHELKGLSTRLCEPGAPSNSSFLEKEISSKSFESTQLHLRLQTASSEAESLRQSLQLLEVENQRLRSSMEESCTNNRTIELRGSQLEAENSCLRDQIKSVKEEALKMIEDVKATSKKDIQLHCEEQNETFQREKEILEKSSGILLGKLQGVQDSLANAQKMIDDRSEERTALLRESEKKIQHLTEANSEIVTRMEVQATELQRYQESETASCLERNELQERLRQAHERCHELEQSLASDAANQSFKKASAGDIVPFSEIQRKLSSPRAPSTYFDPGDFAMLFMSDEICPSSPYNLAKETRDSITNTRARKNQPENPPAHGISDNPVCSPKELRSPSQPKRKAVNFEPQAPQKLTARTSSARSVLTQVPHDSAERANKVTKHVHKWTYSRVRSSGTEIQKEQPTGSAHLPTAERRVSPKGLVSASSGNKASKRINSRGRGKRRSRGERYSARFSQED